MIDYNISSQSENDSTQDEKRKKRLENATQTESRLGEEYGIGKTITREGPGDGYASYPWILDDYERDLGLTTRETWLLKRFMKHTWKFGDPAFPSMRKITRNAIISSATLKRITDSLLQKGYIAVLKDGEGTDRRKRYDIGGVLFALSYAIRSAPHSKWCKRNKVVRELQDCLPEKILNLVDADLINGERITVGMINEMVNEKGYFIDWRNRRLYELKDVNGRRKLTEDEVMQRIGVYVDDKDG